MAEWKTPKQPAWDAAGSGSGRGDSSGPIPEVGRRRQEQLLSAVLVTSLIVTAVLGVSLVLLMPNTPVLKNAEFLLVVSVGVMSAVAYVLNRAGYYALAAPLTVGLAGLSVLAEMLLIGLGTIPHHRPNDTSLLVWLIVPILLGSVLLSIRSLTIVIIFYLGSTLILLVPFPQVAFLDTLFRPLEFILLVSIVTLLVTHYRNQLERDRQAELAEKEDRYRSLLETTFEGIAIVERGTIIDANSGFARMFGHPFSEVIGLPVSTFFSGASPPLGTNTLEPGLPQPMEALGIRPQGETFHVELFFRAHVHQGRAVHVMAIRDVTEQRQAEAEIRQHAAQLAALREVEMDLLAELNLEDLLHSIVSRAVALVGGALGGLYLYQPERGELECTTTVGAGTVPLEASLRQGEELTCRVWSTGETIIVDNDQPSEEQATTHQEPPVAAAIGVPIQWGEEFLGVLHITKEAPKIFAPSDAEMLNLLATQAAIAIKNACLFQAEREQRALAEALRRATAAVNSTLDLEQVFDRILDQMNRVIPSDTANIMLIEGDHIRVVRCSGYERFGGDDHLQSVAFPVAQTSTLRQMYDTGDPVIVPDTLEYDGWIRVSKWVRSYAGAPIRVRNQVIGFLNVNGTTPGFFNSTHTDHLRAFADQASVAIENARLFKETSRRVEHLATLHQIGLAITSDLELTEVLNTLYHEIERIIDVGAFYVALYDQETGMIEFPLLTGKTGRQQIDPLNIHSQPGITGYVIQTGRPLYVPNIWQALEDKTIPYSTIPLTDMPTQSYIGVPLVSRDRVIGVISVQSYKENAYTTADVELLTTVASQATIAIENAQLFRVVERGKRDWEATFDAMQDAIILVDKDQRIARVNQSFADLIQKPFLEIVGQKYDSVLEDVTCPLQSCRLEEARQAGHSARCTHEYRGRAFEVEITPIVEEGNEEMPPKPLPRLIQVMRDVTERKQAEEEIRGRNRELALVNRVIAASASSQEMEHILEIVCRELAQALGVPRAAASLLDEGKTRSIIVAEFPTNASPSVRGLVIVNSDDPAFQASLQQRATIRIDDARNDPRLTPWRDVVDQHGIVSLLMLPLMVEGQAVGHLYLVTTEPHIFTAMQVGLAQRTADQVSGAIARARLERTQRRLSVAVEQAAEGIVIADTDSIVLYMNPAFEQISGYSRAEVVGQKARVLRGNRQNDTFYQHLRQAVTAGQVWQGRIVNAKKDGALYTVDSTITPVRNPAGEIVNYVATMRDVTREMELEEQFQQAQRMEALGRLAGGIAHDFNNLLTVMHISARLLERNLRPEDPLWEHVQRIQETGERATRLNTQLLSFSRHQVIDPQVLDLNKVVADMSRMLQRIIGEDIDLVTYLGQDLWPVKADPVQMDQVLMNLVINARDAMPRGGTLTIATANVVLDEAYAARHVDIQAGDYVQLAVRDTGVGMTEEVLAHLFEPFFTTKQGGQGTGLGLATVFGIVKQSEGHIRVHSQVGHGTAFLVHLPRAGGGTDQDQPQAKSARDPRLARGSETILVVEDEAGVRQLTDRILSTFGYQVLTAENGAEGLAISRQYDGPIHMLLTDVIMPHMNGKELAEQIKAERPDIKVLYMSGYTKDLIARQGVLEPETAFIAKPLTLERLTEKVRSVLDGVP